MTSITKTHAIAAEQADELLSRLILQIGRCLKSRTPETVHDLRVAIRRLTQALIAFKCCFSSKEVKKVRRGLKKILAAAGQVRNNDIALELISKLETENLDALLKTIKQDRRQADQSLAGLLKRRMDAKWRNRLLARPAAGKHAFESIGDTAVRILPRLTKAFFASGNRVARPKSSPEDLHRFRLATKKFRYTLELFRALYGPELEASFEQLRTVQSLLGDVSDCETVREIAARESAPDGVEALLRKRSKKKIKAFREEWEKQFGGRGLRRDWIDRLFRFEGKPPARKAGTKPVAAPSAPSAAA